MSDVAQAITEVWKARKNSAYRIIFNAHALAFFCDDSLVPQYKSAAMRTVIPLSVTNKSIGGKIRHVLLDARDPGCNATGGLLGALGVEVLCHSFADLSGIRDAYALLTSRSSFVQRRKVTNLTEQALYRDLSSGLLQRIKRSDYDAIKALKEADSGDDATFFRTIDEASRTSQQSLTVHPEYALSKLVDPCAASLTERQRQLISTSRVDFLVTARATAKEPRFAGSPMLAVEYDGPHHQERGQLLKDKEKNDLFRNARVPLIRFSHAGLLVRDAKNSYLSTGPGEEDGLAAVAAPRSTSRSRTRSSCSRRQGARSSSPRGWR